MITIKVEIDPTNLELMDVALVFLDRYGELRREVIEEPKATKPAAKTTTAKKPAAKTTTAKKPAAKPSSKTKGVTIDMIREGINKNIDDHRDAITKKLRSFKARNVSTLEEKYYEEMFEFLNSL